MYHYKIYCTDLFSDIKFIQLHEDPDIPENTDDAIFIRAGKFPEHLINEKECFSVVSDRESYLTNSYCLIYIIEGKTIEYEVRPGVDIARIPTYLLGWGLSMLLFQRNQAVIHCSALYRGDDAYLVCGRSGSGKSTMTSMLLDNGFSFMADDTSAALIRDDGVYATPCFPYRKLCRDVVVSQKLNEEELIYIDEDKDKFLVPYEEDFPTEPIKIKTLVFIERVYAPEGEEPPASEIIEVTGMAKMGYIRKVLFLDPLIDNNTPPQMLFKMMLDLAGKMPIYIVTRPDGVDSRDEVFQNILKVTDTI